MYVAAPHRVPTILMSQIHLSPKDEVSILLTAAESVKPAPAIDMMIAVTIIAIVSVAR
jgi:hypothetical protein